jgi:hypothetical protein
MPFISEILKYSSLSIVGMEKNTGKTECLNYVLKHLPLQDKKIAVTSIGIDGETTDQVTKTAKPEIFLRKGMFFGTSETHYRTRKLVSELIDVSNITTSLGRIVTGKALSNGKVQLSGPSSGFTLKQWMKEVHNMGVDLVVVDGALSRLSSASPAVSESMILSTGASLSINIQTLVQKTAYVVDLTNLALTTEQNIKSFSPIEKGIWAINEEGILCSMNASSSLVCQNLDFDEIGNCKALFVSGALVDGFLEKVIQNKKLKGVEIIVRDFTKIFVSQKNLRLFLHLGGKLNVLQRSKLIAVCVNPTSPSGYVLDSNLLCNTLSKAIKLPVYDLRMISCN